MMGLFLRAGLVKGCFLTAACLSIAACTIVEFPYHITKGAVKTAAYVVEGSYELTAGTTKVMYRIGKFTFKAVKAPLEWPLTSGISTIDGLPPKEAIRQGRVKTAPYTVKGKTYYPMSIEEAKTYRATGTASWYGYETSRNKYGHMTANGEAFDPEGLTAAHKYLPLPTHVKVTNLENGHSVILRVNDRGPFPSDRNPSSGERILDVSARAARLLGFYHKGLARVQIEVIQLQATFPTGVPPSAFPAATSASSCSAPRGVWGGNRAEPCASPAAVRVRRGELLDRARTSMAHCKMGPRTSDL